MSQSTNHSAVLFHFLQLCLNVFFTIFSFVLLGILGERFLLGLAPVPVESPLNLLSLRCWAQMVLRGRIPRGVLT